MEKSNKNIPDQTDVRNIFNDTYNVFYKKWKNISKPEQWVDMMQDMREIDQKYKCDLCRQILLELVKVIEHEFKRRDTSVNTNN